MILNFYSYFIVASLSSMNLFILPATVKIVTWNFHFSKMFFNSIVFGYEAHHRNNLMSVQWKLALEILVLNFGYTRCICYSILSISGQSFFVPWFLWLFISLEVVKGIFSLHTSQCLIGQQNEMNIELLCKNFNKEMFNSLELILSLWIYLEEISLNFIHIRPANKQNLNFWLFPTFMVNAVLQVVSRVQLVGVENSGVALNSTISENPEYGILRLLNIRALLRSFWLCCCTLLHKLLPLFAVDNVYSDAFWLNIEWNQWLLK